MRNMPELRNGQKQQKLTTTFLGYNHREIITDGEMYDMKNLSGDLYPLMTIRKKRAYTSFEVSGVSDPLTGIDGRDQLTFILGTKVYWNFNEVPGLTVDDSENMCPKYIANFGAYVCIWPDKKYFNTVNLSDYGTIDRLFSIGGGSVSLTLCRVDGTDYDMTQITVSSTAPSSPANGKLWIDTSGDSDVLRQWMDSVGEWMEVATTFVKVAATGIGSGLNQYDAITLENMEAVSGTGTHVTQQISDLNGSKIVYECGNNYIVVAGLLSASQAALKAQTIRADRKVPDLDYITESNNRLWGCRYGLVDGEVVNEIRCSALGDFRNWERFLGNSQDSYVASVGTDGPFTGCVTQKGYPVFFKEDCIHQVHGTTPSSFQIDTTVCRGIQSGSWRSAVVVNERVYYKSRQDVMVFDGSLPQSVSTALGNVLYSDARAGAMGNKYYISMKDGGGNWTLFTYDTESNVWYKEDSFRALGFGKVADELFAIDETNNLLWSMGGSVGTPEEDFDWQATFGIQGAEYTMTSSGRSRADTPGSRYMSRFDIRMYLEKGTTAKLQIQYNDDGVWRDKGEIRGARTRSFVLPIVPIRCDHLRFRMTGKGQMRVYSICRILEVGADGGAY